MQTNKICGTVKCISNNNFASLLIVLFPLLVQTESSLCPTKTNLTYNLKVKLI
jgi:hypothetical protein